MSDSPGMDKEKDQAPGRRLEWMFGLSNLSEMLVSDHQVQIPGVVNIISEIECVCECE